MAILPVRSIDPLNHAVPIVDQHGRPTPQFGRQWVLARVVNLQVEDVTVSLDDLRLLVEQAQAALTALEAQLAQAGTGLEMDEDGRTLHLTDTGVAAGVYGSATHVPQITVDAQGRITAVTEVEI